MTENSDSCHHVQWVPLCDEMGVPIRDEKGEGKHWVCSCGVIVPDPPDFHPEESLELVIEEVVRAFQELLATSAPTTDETPAMIKLLRNLQAAIDEWNRSKDGKTS